MSRRRGVAIRGVVLRASRRWRVSCRDELCIARSSAVGILIEHRQREACREPRPRGAAEISPVTRPRVVFRTASHACGYRIEMNVANDFEEITVGIDEARAVAALEEMSRRRHRALEASRVSHRDRVNCTSQRQLADLHQQVKVIRHPAVGVHHGAVARGRLPDDLVEILAIGRRAEDRLAVITAERDVIEASGYVDARGVALVCSRRPTSLRPRGARRCRTLRPDCTEMNARSARVAGRPPGGRQGNRLVAGQDSNSRYLSNDKTATPGTFSNGKPPS